ncbi:hypothetical protein Glove_476g36 [Diversispora epigaea]|uniref:Uncharacterized protein n=1 Tax=Diversispora epigaea TaxID=1348612 RepID=A0A397GL83_9GLOM|nr:hypothetical protein Glove_476g36 [Diversispora epigaea]
MYEMVTAQRPFADQAHDTYLMKCDDPSERPTSIELSEPFLEIYEKIFQLEIADKNTSKSQKQELFELFSHSSKLHPQSCYISQYIHTLHGLYYLLEDLKSGKSAVDNNVMQQLEIADKNTSKSQKQELFELFSHSSKLHPQSCYISQYIHTLHGLYYLLEDLKSGKSAEECDEVMAAFLKSKSPEITAAHYGSLLYSYKDILNGVKTKNYRIICALQNYTVKIKFSSEISLGTIKKFIDGKSNLSWENVQENLNVLNSYLNTKAHTMLPHLSSKSKAIFPEREQSKKIFLPRGSEILFGFMQSIRLGWGK